MKTKNIPGDINH